MYLCLAAALQLTAWACQLPLLLLPFFACPAAHDRPHEIGCRVNSRWSLHDLHGHACGLLSLYQHLNAEELNHSSG